MAQTSCATSRCPFVKGSKEPGTARSSFFLSERRGRGASWAWVTLRVGAVLGQGGPAEVGDDSAPRALVLENEEARPRGAGARVDCLTTTRGVGGRSTPRASNVIMSSSAMS